MAESEFLPVKLEEFADIPDVQWKMSPHGFWYNGGTPDAIRNLQRQLIERGMSPAVYCVELGGCVYYTPVDPTYSPGKILSAQII